MYNLLPSVSSPPIGVMGQYPDVLLIVLLFGHRSRWYRSVSRGRPPGDVIAELDVTNGAPAAGVGVTIDDSMPIVARIETTLATVFMKPSFT